VQEWLTPSLQMNHPGRGEKREHSFERVKRKVSVAPVGSVHCSRAVGAGRVAPRCDFNLYPVEPWHPLEFPPSSKMIGKGFSQYSHRHLLHHFLKDILLLKEPLYFVCFQDDENPGYLFETDAGDTRVHKPGPAKYPTAPVPKRT
jgi:hypothetical protein